MKYKLSDLFELQMGKTPERSKKEYWDIGIKDWISIADISGCDKYIYSTKERISTVAEKETGIRIIPKNTVIMSFKLSIGKVAITSKEMYSNEAIMAFIDKEVEEIDEEYLYYMFSGMNWDTGTNKAVMGKTLNKATLSQQKIKLHSAIEQAKIVKNLKVVTDIINMRRQQLLTLDNLIKSRFVEMFGDPSADTKEGKETIEGMCEAIVGGGTPSMLKKEYYEGGDIPWLKSGDIKSMRVSRGVSNITKLGLEKSTAKLLPANSIIVVTRSGILKHTLPVAIAENEVAINQDLKGLIPKRNVVPEYLLWVLKLSEPVFLSKVRAVTADNFETSMLKKHKVINPPLALQQQFADFVQQVDKSKFAFLTLCGKELTPPAPSTLQQYPIS